jgi:arabinofuranosyltransferase
VNRSHIGVTLGAAAAAAALFILWRKLYFYPDDAYILFRYAANSRAGWGYVWNPPPFRPVEGYTSWLWVVILDVVWRLTGLEPPQSANVLALLASAGILLLSYRLALRVCRGGRFERWAPGLAGLVVAGILANRTFLFSSSSGLDTALSCALALAWLSEALTLPTAPRRTLLLPTLAALTALCRPEGLAYVGATAVIVLIQRRETAPVRWWSLGPLLAVPAHLLWRHHTYGQWLPNTFFAKVVRPWPDAGIRYLLSFVLEYALFVPAALLVAGIVARVLEVRRRHATPSVLRALRTAAALGAPIVVATYYVLIVGGDYFEYRPFLILVPLLFVGVLWSVRATSPGAPGWAAVALLVTVASGSALSLLHFRIQAQKYVLFDREFVPVAPEVPAVFRGYVSRFDKLQDWLISRKICRRYHMHRALAAFLQAQTPQRDSWSKTHPFSDRDIMVAEEYAVGYAGWALSTVAIIDKHGLNDAVVARAPVTASNDDRALGHDRFPPLGYVECFQPNVNRQRAIIYPRGAPLTARDVIKCEREYAPGSHEIFPLAVLRDPLPDVANASHGALLVEMRHGQPPTRTIVQSWSFPCDDSLSDPEPVQRRLEALVRIETPGDYRFWCETDDNGAFWVAGRRIFDTKTLSTRVFHLRFERAGLYPFRLEVSNLVAEWCADLRMGRARSDVLTPIPLQQLLVPPEARDLIGSGRTKP